MRFFTALLNLWSQAAVLQRPTWTHSVSLMYLLTVGTVLFKAVFTSCCSATTLQPHEGIYRPRFLNFSGNLVLTTGELWQKPVYLMQRWIKAAVSSVICFQYIVTSNAPKLHTETKLCWEKKFKFTAAEVTPTEHNKHAVYNKCSWVNYTSWCVRCMCLRVHADKRTLFQAQSLQTAASGTWTTCRFHSRSTSVISPVIPSGSAGTWTAEAETGSHTTSSISTRRRTRRRTSLNTRLVKQNTWSKFLMNLYLNSVRAQSNHIFGSVQRFARSQAFLNYYFLDIQLKWATFGWKPEDYPRLISIYGLSEGITEFCPPHPRHCFSGHSHEAGGEGGSPADDGQRTLVPESPHRVHGGRPNCHQTARWRLQHLPVERDCRVLHCRSDSLNTWRLQLIFMHSKTKSLFVNILMKAGKCVQCFCLIEDGSLVAEWGEHNEVRVWNNKK